MAKKVSRYDVGYGKPPASGKFKEGQSGNSKGRPKGSKNLATILMKECRKRVRINGPNGTRSVTKLEAIVMQLVNKAAQGDPRSLREFLPLVQIFEDAVGGSTPPNVVPEKDQQVMQSIMRRLKNIGAGTSPSNSEPEEK